MSKLQPFMLLIDDDEDDLELFSSGLVMKGIKVKSFDSSEKALFYLTLEENDMGQPSLIILDYNMPKKNGRQVLQSIKDNKLTRNIPVVMYSTSMSPVLKTHLLEAGALDCFEKPWSYKELNRHVEKFQELAYAL